MERTVKEPFFGRLVELESERDLGPLIGVESKVVLPEDAREGAGCWGKVAAILRPPCGEPMALVELSRTKEWRRTANWNPYPVTVPLRTLRLRSSKLKGLAYKDRADHRIPKSTTRR